MIELHKESDMVRKIGESLHSLPLEVDNARIMGSLYTVHIHYSDNADADLIALTGFWTILAATLLSLPRFHLAFEVPIVQIPASDLKMSAHGAHRSKAGRLTVRYVAKLSHVMYGNKAYPAISST